MAVNTTIDNSCPRCKADKPIHVQVGNKHWIKCAKCSWAFELLGIEETATKPTTNPEEE